jgi:hypothetical protein
VGTRNFAVIRHIVGSVRSRELMSTLIDSISHGIPKALSEVVMLERALRKGVATFAAGPLPDYVQAEFVQERCPSA